MHHTRKYFVCDNMNPNLFNLLIYVNMIIGYFKAGEMLLPIAMNWVIFIVVYIMSEGLGPMNVSVKLSLGIGGYLW